jgi:hypothetical protein
VLKLPLADLLALYIYAVNAHFSHKVLFYSLLHINWRFWHLSTVYCTSTCVTTSFCLVWCCGCHLNFVCFCLSVRWLTILYRMSK